MWRVGRHVVFDQSTIQRNDQVDTVWHPVPRLDDEPRWKGDGPSFAGINLLNIKTALVGIRQIFSVAGDRRNSDPIVRGSRCQAGSLDLARLFRSKLNAEPDSEQHQDDRGDSDSDRPTVLPRGTLLCRLRGNGNNDSMTV